MTPQRAGPPSAAEQSGGGKAAFVRFGGLDALRVMGFGIVFLAHAYVYAGFPDMVVRLGEGRLDLAPMVRSGGYGIALFFLLSAFLLGRKAWRELDSDKASESPKLFIGRRLLRLYPAYSVAILVYAFTRGLGYTPLGLLVHVTTHLALVHNFSELTVASLSTPLWYIATVAQLYAVFPLFFWLMRRARRRGASRPAIALGLVLGTAALGIAWDWAAPRAIKILHIDPRMADVNGLVIDAFPLHRLPNIGAGIALAGATVGDVGERLRQRMHVLATTLVVLSLIGLIACRYGLDRNLMLAVDHWPAADLFYSALIIGVIYCPQGGWLSRILNCRILRWGGKISYSFFLFHELCLWTVFTHWPSRWLSVGAERKLALSMVAFLLSLAAGWTCFELVEKRLGTVISRTLASRGWLP